MGNKPKKNKPGILIPLFVAALTFSIILIFATLYSEIRKHDSSSDTNTEKIQSCPDNWYINRMPGNYAETDDKPSEYMVYNGQRTELTEVDVDWVKSNCPTKEPQPVY